MYIHLNSLDQISLTFVLISSLVAAALGGFNSLPLAGVGGLAVGLIFSFGQGYTPIAGIGELLVFVALLRCPAAAVEQADPRSCVGVLMAAS